MISRLFNLDKFHQKPKWCVASNLAEYYVVLNSGSVMHNFELRNIETMKFIFREYLNNYAKKKKGKREKERERE